MAKQSKNIFARSPTLDTVLMIEDIIKKHSGDYTRRQLWLNLPRKVMWQTYVLVIDYLLEDGKIMADRKGYLVWIYNPKLVAYYLKHPELEWHDDQSSVRKRKIKKRI